MSLESSSALFSARMSREGGADIRYGLERFLHNELHSDRIYCKFKEIGSIATIRVGSPVLVEQVLIRLHDIRLYAKRELNCDIADIRVMLQ